MWENKTQRVEERIVSLTQPHIRPIVRGKAKNPTEFGAKLSVSCVDNTAAKLITLEANYWQLTA